MSVAKCDMNCDSIVTGKTLHPPMRSNCCLCGSFGRGRILYTHFSLCIVFSYISSWASAKLLLIAILRQSMKLKYSELYKLQHTMLVFVKLPYGHLYPDVCLVCTSYRVIYCVAEASLGTTGTCRFSCRWHPCSSCTPASILS